MIALDDTKSDTGDKGKCGANAKKELVGAELKAVVTEEPSSGSLCLLGYWVTFALNAL